MRRFFGVILIAVCLLFVGMSFTTDAYAKDVKGSVDTKLNISIIAEGSYVNWDGVSNVAQFVDGKGNFRFAYEDGDYIIVQKVTSSGLAKSQKVKLKKMHPLFGNVTCDSKGNFYVITGEENKGDDTSVETVFISKYNSKGKHIRTVGDNGFSSLADYYENRFCTKQPFDAGNCDVAVNGKLLSVHYARKMYSGHQSDSVFSINTDTMEKVNTGVMYESHSFAQRVVPYKEGFAYASEGDCFERVFMINTDSLKNSGAENAVFHFWVSQGAYDRYDMYEVNNNFAHMGGLANLDDKLVAFVGTSVKSLNEKANSEKEQLFIQIFNPDQQLSGASDYRTKGTRSGLGGNNGDKAVTDYGVKWLTSYNSKYTIKNPQVVAADGKAVVLFEKYEGYNFVGTYYIVVNKKGQIVQKAKRYSKSAHLNPCTMPVFANNRITWAGNNEGGRRIRIYSLGINN